MAAEVVTTAPDPARRRASALAAALAVVVWLLLGAWAGVAGAHAVVTSSSPADGARLPTAPSEVVIHFSEGITSDLGGLTVLDQRGQRVDNGDSGQPDGTTLRATLHDGLGPGTYVANYKVVSADGHPVSGAIVFGVGSGSLADVSAVAQTGDPTLEALGAVARFLTYAGALFSVGVAFFLAFLYDGAADWGPLGRVVRLSAVVAAAGALLTIAVQAGLATGRGLGAATEPSTLGPVLREGLGAQTVSLFIGLALCQVALSTRTRIAAQALVFYGGLAATSAFVWWGHATESERSWLAIPSDVVHTTVAAVWAGGLLGLAVLLRQRSRSGAAGTPATLAAAAGAGADGVVGPVTGDAGALDTGPDTGRALVGDPAPEGHALERPGSFAATIHVVERFSTAAAISVIALAVTGTALAVSELGSVGALTDSTYGRTLLIKLALVAVIVFIAGFNRYRLLPWLLGTADDDTDDADGDVAASEGDVDDDEIPTPAGHWRPLIRTLLVEALGIVAVLGVTAVLVNQTPPANVVAPSPPFQQTAAFRDGKVSLTITPNRPGTNDLHLEFLGPDGKPADPARQVQAEFRLPDKGLGPITRELPKAGPGHFLLENVNDLSIPGTWEITLVSRVSDFDQVRTTFRDTVS